MPQITITYEGAGVRALLAASQKLSAKRWTQMARSAMSSAGNKTRTQVRKALKAQMGTKAQRPINAGTSRAFLSGDLEFTIVGAGKGLPITEFPVRASRSLKSLVRWNPRQHWRLQVRPRQKGGRFSKIADEGFATPGVTASPWGVAHAFKRSYVDLAGTYRAKLPGQNSRAKGRLLYGPGVAKEIVKDASAATFSAFAPQEMDRQIARRFAAFMP